MKVVTYVIKSPDECPYRYIDYYPFDIGTGRCKKLHGKECGFNKLNGKPCGKENKFPEYCILKEEF